MSTPRTSIIVTCKPRTNLEALKKSLASQTYQDFELIATHNKKVAEGLNSGIKRARGRILVITESDCIWNSPYLLELLIKSLENKTAVTLQGESIECVAISKKDCIPFDERLIRAEDTLWFKQLGEHGIRIKKLFIHNKSKSLKKAILWNLRYPFDFVYGGMLPPSHIFGRALYYILIHLLHLIVLPAAVVYAFVRKKLKF